MPGKVFEPDIRQQLERVLNGKAFRKAAGRRRLLTYLTEQTLQGKPPSEEEIAVRISGRWTIETGNKVRVYVNRLKEALERYYKNEGRGDQVILQIEGYEVTAKRPTLPSVAPRPGAPAVPSPFETHEAFFFENGAAPSCIVTGQSEEVDWHALDKGNYSLGVLVPLCNRLRTNLAAVEEGKRRTLLPELNPKRLTETLAPRYYQTWKVANAYGCAALAFYMGMPPYGSDSASQQVLRLCDVIHYARHRYLEALMHQVIQTIALPYLFRLQYIDPGAGARIAIQFTALLEESGYYDDAEMALKLAGKLSKRAESFLSNGSQNAFVLNRRQAQLHAERKPNDRRFDYLLQKAKEHTAHHDDRRLTLDVVQVHRALRIGSPESLEKAWQILGDRTAQYQQHFQNGQWVIPAGLAAADFSEIFMLDAIVTSHLRPGGWKSSAEESTFSAQTLMRIGHHTLPTIYSEFIGGVTTRSNLKATRLLRMTGSRVRRPLGAPTRAIIAALVRHMDGL